MCSFTVTFLLIAAVKIVIHCVFDVAGILNSTCTGAGVNTSMSASI